jgi:Derlin-1
MSSDFSDWYKSVPQMTRYWFTGSVVLPLIARFGLISPQYLVLLFQPFLSKFQFWRPITALFYYPISPQTGFSYLINLYFLYSYSSRLETSTFDGKPADYLFMLIFNWILLVLIGFAANIYMLMDPMILSVMYVWCQLNRETIVQFWFGTQFKAIYLPWVLVGFNLIVKGGGFIELLGIAIGHVYFFLMFKYPQDFNGAQLLKTPDILYKYFPNRSGGVSG